MADIFISYSRDDRDRVRTIAEALEREGFSVWWDPEIPPGETYAGVIDREIKSAGCVIAVWSNSAVASNWVQEEADDGLTRGALIPLLIDDVELPRGFKRVQTANLVEWKGDPDDQTWRLVVSQIRRMVERTAAGETEPAAAAPIAPAPAPVATPERAPEPAPRPDAAAPAAPASSGLSPVLLGGGAFAVAAAAAAGLFFSGVFDPKPEPTRDVASLAEPDAVDAAADEIAIANDASDASGEDATDAAASEPEAPVETETEDAPETPAAPTAPAFTAGDRIADCAQCPEMIVIPAGDFTMGSPDGERQRDDSEGPQQAIAIDRPFALGRTEVTVAEWSACVAGGGCNGYTPATNAGSAPNLPVVNVSWDDAQAYVAWLSAETGETYRLPSEAEWEYAARAGTTTPFTFGDTIRPDQAIYDHTHGYAGGPTRGAKPGGPSAVGSTPANALGLNDMHGNVWEWTQDCWSPSLAGADATGAARTSGDCSKRVARGGAFNAWPWRLRSAHRLGYARGERDYDNGFRVARDLE